MEFKPYLVDMMTRGVWCRRQVWHLVVKLGPDCEPCLSSVEYICGDTGYAHVTVFASIDDNRVAGRRMCKACRAAATEHAKKNLTETMNMALHQ